MFALTTVMVSCKRIEFQQSNFGLRQNRHTIGQATANVGSENNVVCSFLYCTRVFPCKI